MTPRDPGLPDLADVIPSHTFSNASLLDPPETGGPNGGYLAKLLWEASVDRVRLHELAPRVVTVQFMSSPAYEPLWIDVEVPRRSHNRYLGQDGAFRWCLCSTSRRNGSLVRLFLAGPT
jgi:hypothetical protein